MKNWTWWAILAFSVSFSVVTVTSIENSDAYEEDAEGDFLPCSYTKIYHPVCGTDGKTYSNPGALGCAAQAQNGLRVKHNGPCGVQTAPPSPGPGTKSVYRTKVPRPAGCDIPAPFDPVCGSDGITYSNLKQLDCERPRKPGLRHVYKGRCRLPGRVKPTQPALDSKCPPPSDTGFDPVCGSDGITYYNVKYLECEQQKQPGLEESHTGQCQVAPQTVAPQPPKRPIVKPVAIKSTSEAPTESVSIDPFPDSIDLGPAREVESTTTKSPIVRTPGSGYRNRGGPGFNRRRPYISRSRAPLPPPISDSGSSKGFPNAIALGPFIVEEDTTTQRAPFEGRIDEGAPLPPVRPPLKDDTAEDLYNEDEELDNEAEWRPKTWKSGSSRKGPKITYDYI